MLELCTVVFSIFQRCNPSVLDKDEDGRHYFVSSGLFSTLGLQVTPEDKGPTVLRSPRQSRKSLRTVESHRRSLAHLFPISIGIIFNYHLVFSFFSVFFLCYLLCPLP